MNNDDKWVFIGVALLMLMMMIWMGTTLWSVVRLEATLDRYHAEVMERCSR